jgi:hypothetical protein
VSRPATAAEAYRRANRDGRYSSGPVRWYSSGCGRIELAITLEDAESGYHSGQCDADIAELRKVPYIAEQLAALHPDTVREVALESGRNDYGHGDQDNADHDANLSYVLWTACAEIQEEAGQ